MTVPTGPVADATNLYRRIAPSWLVPDRNRDCVRVSSAAYKDHDLSVYLEDALAALNRIPASVLEAFPGYFLTSFNARVARDLGLTVERSPNADDPAHGEVVGPKPRGGVAKRLRDAARWDVPPPDACEDELAAPVTR